MKKSSPLFSTVWLISEKILSMGLGLLTTLVLARHMGPVTFGQLNYLIAIVALLTPFAAMGLNSLITRELVLTPDNKNKILGSALGVRIVFAIIASFITFCLSPYFIAIELRLSFCILLTANIFTSFLVFDYWLQAHVANVYAVKARLSVLTLMTCIRLVAVFYDASLAFFVILAAVEIVLTALAFLLIYILKGGGIGKLEFCYNTAKSLLSQSWWLMLSGIAAIIYLKIDQVMLGQMSSDEQVGIYAVAARLSEVWYFFPVALVSSYFPKLLKAKQTSRVKYHQNLQILCDWLFLTSLVIALLVLLVGEYIVIILFGDAYQESAVVLAIHIWAGIFIFMRALLSKWLIAENLLRFSLVTQLAGALLNVLVNYLLIPEYAAVGAAVATVLSYAVASYLALFLHRKTWPMAKTMSLSFLLPLRVVTKGKFLYK
ncbi:MAG: PST family polysaccharide transporter [Colwellia polaris]